MTVYSAEIESAASDIRDAGAPVTFARGARTHDKATGRMSGTPTTASSYAVRVKGDAKRLAARNLVLKDPITLLVEALHLGTFVPEDPDSMTFAGATYTVKDVDTLAPDGAAITYRVTGSR